MTMWDDAIQARRQIRANIQKCQQQLDQLNESIAMYELGNLLLDLAPSSRITYSPSGVVVKWGDTIIKVDYQDDKWVVLPSLQMLEEYLNEGR